MQEGRNPKQIIIHFSHSINKPTRWSHARERRRALSMKASEWRKTHSARTTLEVGLQRAQVLFSHPCRWWLVVASITHLYGAMQTRITKTRTGKKQARAFNKKQLRKTLRFFVESKAVSCCALRIFGVYMFVYICFWWLLFVVLEWNGWKYCLLFDLFVRSTFTFLPLCRCACWLLPHDGLVSC